ncbi:Guanosine-diphosphatase [Tulasnella sp. 418]|nr:Guanosine-diphosphatase [Tulasnella sp. 418]
MNDLNLGASNDYDYESNSSSSESPSPLFSPKSSSSAVGLHTSTATMRPTKISLNILPRTSGGGYAVLESGGGSKGPRRLGWKSIVVLLAFFFGTLWLLGPRESYDKYMHPDKSDAPYEDIDFPKTVPTNQPHPPFVPTKGNSKVTVDEDEEDDEYPEKPKTLPTAPHSPETDPDARKTVHCIRPHDPTKPLVQYALMLDAGSTGSRIHIYKFHNCFASGPTLEYEVFKMTRPGLSSYAGKPQDAAESLDELMAEAVKVVPSDFQGCTKVAVKATAGLRLLGTDASQDILDAVKARLKSNYKFQLAGADAVTIMDGKDEGVFAWITANYLLGTIGGTNKHDRPTYAVLDLGGASTQIVFEPRFDSKSRLEEGDHKYVLTFSGKAHTLYQHSYLGYGLMQARRSVHNLVAFMWDFKLQSHGHGSLGSVDDVPLVANPCLAKDTKKIIKLDGGKWKDEAYGYNVTMVGEDVGSFEACNRVVELVMAKDA